MPEVPVELRYSLKYYDALFGGRTPAWAELVAALADEMDDYAAELASAARGGTSLAPVRHSHRPSLQNLGVETAEPDDGLTAAEADQFAAALRGLAAELRTEARRPT